VNPQSCYRELRLNNAWNINSLLATKFLQPVNLAICTVIHLIHLSTHRRHHCHSRHPSLLHFFTPSSKPTFSTNASHLNFTSLPIGLPAWRWRWDWTGLITLISLFFRLSFLITFLFILCGRLSCYPSAFYCTLNIYTVIQNNRPPPTSWLSIVKYSVHVMSRYFTIMYVQLIWYSKSQFVFEMSTQSFDASTDGTNTPVPQMPAPQAPGGQERQLQQHLVTASAPEQFQVTPLSGVPQVFGTTAFPH